MTITTRRVSLKWCITVRRPVSDWISRMKKDVKKKSVTSSERSLKTPFSQQRKASSRPHTHQPQSLTLWRSAFPIGTAFPEKTAPRKFEARSFYTLCQSSISSGSELVSFCSIFKTCFGF